MRISFFDFETTGLDPEKDRVTELAVQVVDTDTWRTIESYQTLIWDDEYPEIHPDAAKMTGLSTELIKRFGTYPYAAFGKLFHLLEYGEFICGHNIRKFDMKFLNEYIKRNGVQVELPPTIDTRFDPVYPSHITTRKLAYLAHELEIISTSAHSALVDVQTTISLLKKFDLNEVLTRAQSPDIYIQACVNYDNRNKAKELGYGWDGNRKIWFKLIKECDYEKEQGEFQKIRLENYEPPKQ